MISVLRLGHRISRDTRITTHCALVARAFGADEIILSGEKDSGVIKSVDGITLRWGGEFTARYEKNWKKVLKEWKKKGGKIVHLTMYGLRVQDEIAEVREQAKKAGLLVVIGAEKVPAEVYELADWNIGVTNQPHSEVAALGVFLHMLQKGEELEKKFPGAEIKVEPSARRKTIKEIS